MKSGRTSRIAVVVFAAASLVAGVLSPAYAARNIVVIHSPKPVTGFNSSVTGKSISINADISYLQGIGFNYYDNNKVLIKNTVFGDYKIVKSSAKDFRVQYTVKPGRVWSDGTPITAVDLLLSHVIRSNKYAIAAGLGDPKSTTGTSFKTSAYSGAYDTWVVGDPVLSADKMSLTIRYKGKLADWDVYDPAPSPVHTLILIAEGEKQLGTVVQNEAARNRFLKAYENKDTTILKAIAKVWSESYNITEVIPSTNPLLFVGNGGFTVNSAVTNQSVTLVANPKYNSGPKVSGTIETIIFKFFSDGEPVIQALSKGELDIYLGQPTTDALDALKMIPSVKVVGGKSATYEHWDLRMNAFPGELEYNGIFASKFGQRSLDLRRAFLMGIPRQEIVSKLIAPFNPELPVLRSWMVMPGEDIYEQVINSNGSKYFEGSQDDLNKRAATLVKKYFPDADRNPIKVNVLVPGDNPRRTEIFALAKANLRKVGFELVGDVKVNWTTSITNSKYDASFFGWSAGSVLQSRLTSIFTSSGMQNYSGWSFSAADKIYDELSTQLSRTVVAQKYISLERIFFDNACTLPIFQFPSTAAVNKSLKGIKPNPLNPNLVWNYWEWTY
ncbi:MAG: hypothetical protein EB043_03275 [Actinobacteria bacterium]|jgi:peptide/nickel transport system substrate-binding protein|nr:hypothetical protein [Actinomycetota bacterium]NDB31445.1 hypothetical protein [Actinomycetota bacterium]NDD60295.1 hypothetical protein [Actinomycetota bacterium]NDF42684.1 hypothetical protein [Actinomycetota bacterium]